MSDVLLIRNLDVSFATGAGAVKAVVQARDLRIEYPGRFGRPGFVADEPTSALDVSVQARVLELFAELQKEHLRSSDLPA